MSGVWKCMTGIVCTVFLGVEVQAQIDSNITLLYHWSDTTLPPTTAYNNTYNEIWGVVTGGGEYAIIGSTMGTHFFDVTDPVNAKQVDFVRGKAFGSNIVHRDYHDYKGYLYMVSDEGESSLQIADLQYLPDSVHVVYDSNDLFKRSHNIFIDSATARMYVCSVYSQARGYNGLEVYSLKDPLKPRLMLEYPDIGTIHDIFVLNDTAYCHNGGKGFVVIDFSDTTNITTLGNLEFYPGKGYNHSGWLTKDRKHYVLADETHGSPLKMLDVSDFTDIKSIATFSSALDDSSMAHNPLVKGDLAYVSYYHDGFQLFNISNPALPFKTGYYKTSSATNHSSYKGAWGCYPFLPSGIVLVSDMQNGLFVLDATAAGVGQHELTDGEESVTLFPNPFGSVLNIAGGKETIQEISIHSSVGSKVFHLDNPGNTVHLPDLPPGIYAVTLKTPHGTLQRKILHF